MSDEAMKREDAAMFDTIASIVRKTLGTDDVRPEAKLDDLGADSLAVAELALAIEEAFAITIPEDDLVSIRTVADVAAYVRLRKAS
jgi:acyl carrier protein